MNFTNRHTVQVEQKPKWEETADGFLRCKSRILKECVMPYGREELSSLPDDFQGDVLNMYVPNDAMSDAQALRSLEGAPVVDWDHTWTSPSNARLVQKGSVAGTPVVEGDFLLCDLLITDPQTIVDIKSGDIGEISAAYHADTLFEDGEYCGSPYQAKQTNLRYNHVAIIPNGHGRAGADVRIVNKKSKGENNMADEKTTVRVRLRNSGRFLNTDEDGAKAIEEEMTLQGEASEASGAKLEDTMGELEEKNAQIAALQSETEELKGELSVYKEKLDQLLSDGVIEAAAENMITESDEAEEILENSDELVGEQGEAIPEAKKEEVVNSIRRRRGADLYKATLSAVGVQCQNMSPEALRGAFKAQNQIVKRMGSRKNVSGTKLMNSMASGVVDVKNPTANGRTAHQRLGFGSK